MLITVDCEVALTEEDEEGDSEEAKEEEARERLERAASSELLPAIFSSQNLSF